MKIIDLLNKIANGEEVPDKFKYDNLTFEKRWDNSYFDNEGDDLHESLCVDFSNLNDEIEILNKSLKEEIPEKLDHLIGYDIRQFDDLKEYVEIATNDLFGKVNKIIDTLDSLIDYLKIKGDE